MNHPSLHSRPHASRVAAASIAAVIFSWLAAGTQLGYAADPTLAKAANEVLKAKCVRCHGDKKQQGSLDLRSRDAILKGGESGPAVVPGRPDESRLFKRVRDGEMPPKKADRLSAPQIETLRQWILAGAPAALSLQGGHTLDHNAQAKTRHWAWQKPVRPKVPTVEWPAAELAGQTGTAPREMNPIDAFVLAKLKAVGLAPSPGMAERRT